MIDLWQYRRYLWCDKNTFILVLVLQSARIQYYYYLHRMIQSIFYLLAFGLSVKSFSHPLSKKKTVKNNVWFISNVYWCTLCTWHLGVNSNAILIFICSQTNQSSKWSRVRLGTGAWSIKRDKKVLRSRQLMCDGITSGLA